jgi:hypothetical protein
VLGEEGERRRAAALDARSNAAGVIPSTTISTSFFCMPQRLLVAGERPQTAYRSGLDRLSSGTRANSASTTRYPAAGIQASAATTIAAQATSAPCADPRSAAPQRAAHGLRCAERAGDAPAIPAARSPQSPACQFPITKPMPAPAAPASTMTAILPPRPRLPAVPARRMPIAAPRPALTPIQYHVPMREP